MSKTVELPGYVPASQIDEKRKEIIHLCDIFRVECSNSELGVRLAFSHDFFSIKETMLGQHSEMKANLMLAVRHLEDARMRLGKVVQHANNGVSIYDQNKK